MSFLSKFFSTKKEKNTSKEMKLSFEKVAKTIMSCNTPQQLESSYKMLHNFFILYSIKVSEDTYRLEGETLDAFEELLDIYKNRKQVLLGD